MDLLGEILESGGLFYFVTLGFVNRAGVLVFIALGYNDEQKRRLDAWQKLAKVNNLTFRPGSFVNSAIVAGDYRGYHLTLEAINIGKGSAGGTYTQITLATNRAADAFALLKNEALLTPLLSVEEIMALLTPDALEYSMLEEITVQPWGQKLSYGRYGFETNTKYLQIIFDWLSLLAGTYPTIVALGGEAVSELQEIAVNNGFVRSLATQLLHDIAQETGNRLGYKTQRLLCPICLTHCDAHKVSLNWWQSLTYYGCRVCGQSRQFLDCPQGATAVLDANWSETQSHHNGLLRLNWLQHRQRFDFDRVEIIQATDEDVERFAVQVGNDTDPVRQPRYRQMRCVIGPACRLSENTRRILEHTFGRVEYKEKLVR